MDCESVISNMFAKCLAALLLTARLAFAQDYNCDFAQKVSPGLSYPVRSPRYPNNYTPGVQCRWILDCPDGYNCRIDCSEVNLPNSPSCDQDRLLVSRTGDVLLNGADYYCGQGVLTAVSTGTRLTVGLITAKNSPGGRFTCSASARQAATVPSTCSCGYKKQNRIVGGVETGINEFPMMAALVDARIYEVKCGGTIISNRHVLTAAHCLEGFTVDTLAVVVGEHNVNINDSIATKGYRISRFNIHPQYVPSSASYDYDAAILTLTSDIVFSDRVGPACLPFKYQNVDPTNFKLTILGWGTLSPGGKKPGVLMKVDVDVISQSRCQALVNTVTPRQICTLTPGKDACQDDSGGPLLYTDWTTGALFSFGVVSFGQYCANANQPGVNTRVTALLPWIINTTPGVNYCHK